MKERSNRLRIVVIRALAAAALGGLLASPATASCVSPDELGAPAWQLKPMSGQSGTFRPTLIASAAPDAIVGFWHVVFTAAGNTNGIPDGATIDSAYVQWHSDNTEIMNSSRDPRTSNFCLGVWERTSPLTYTLKHLAMSWDGAGHPVGPATIIENVTLARDGDSFTGTFTITQYAMDGKTVVPPTPIVGTLAGTRITPD